MSRGSYSQALCWWGALGVLAVLAACAGSGHAVRSELFFGLGRPGGGEVSPGQWRDFVDREIVDRFPDGFTVIPADGAWREPGGARTMREPARILVILHPGDAASSAKLDEIRSAYRRQFGQGSVLRVDGPVQADF